MPCAGSPEERPRCLSYLDAPAHAPETLLEIGWRVRDLDGAVGSAIIETTLDRRRRLALDELRGRSVRVVHEEHATARFQTAVDERPERLEALEWDVR